MLRYTSTKLGTLTIVQQRGDEQHLKRVMQHYTKDAFAGIFSAVKIEKVKLNIYHKECKTLLKYMVRDGLKVECYYKED